MESQYQAVDPEKYAGRGLEHKVHCRGRSVDCHVRTAAIGQQLTQLSERLWHTLCVSSRATNFEKFDVIRWRLYRDDFKEHVYDKSFQYAQIVTLAAAPTATKSTPIDFPGPTWIRWNAL